MTGSNFSRNHLACAMYVIKFVALFVEAN